MSKKALCLLSLLLIVGCKTVTSINNKYEKINYSISISKEDAVILAQKHVLNFSRKNINVSSAVIEKEDSKHPVYWNLLTKYPTKVWFVRFWPKVGSISFFKGLMFDYRYYVVVDKVTGVVLDKNGGYAGKMCLW